MTEFIYNNTKNTNTSYIFFELNYKYYFCIFYKKNFDLCLKSQTMDELFFKL